MKCAPSFVIARFVLLLSKGHSKRENEIGVDGVCSCIDGARGMLGVWRSDRCKGQPIKPYY